MPRDAQDGRGAETGTLGKAVAVLEIVARADRPLRFTDILVRAGQPRGTLHRQLANLVAEGLLAQSPSGLYAPGLRLLELASRAWAGNEFRRVAEPHLRRLHEATGETVHLAMLRGTEVVYLDKVEGRQAVRMHSQIGNASPAFCTGVGKAALAALPPAEAEAVIARIAFRSFTPQTLAGPEALAADLARIRATGLAEDREEHEPGIRCVAAPIRPADGSFTAAVSVTVPVFRGPSDPLAAWGPLVAAAARAITDDLGPRLGPRA